MQWNFFYYIWFREQASDYLFIPEILAQQI